MAAIYSVYIRNTPYIMRDGFRYTKQNVIAIPGLVRVHGFADDFFGGPESKDYRSKVMMNPSWGRLFRVFKAQMKRTRDYHHAFLEGFRVMRTERDQQDREVTVIELITGS